MHLPHAIAWPGSFAALIFPTSDCEGRNIPDIE